jgi:hypothetical protein
VTFLMGEHGLTSGYAGAVAAAVNYEDLAPETTVDRQHEGKASLRPAYECVVSEAEARAGSHAVSA